MQVTKFLQQSMSKCYNGYMVNNNNNKKAYPNPTLAKNADLGPRLF